MLHPKIIEVSTDKKTGHTYVLVHFWRTKAARGRSDPPYLIEDFLMDLRPDVDPGIPAIIRANIRRFVGEAEKHSMRGDNSSRNATGGEVFADGRLIRPAGRPIVKRERDQSDPHRVTAIAAVRAMRGKNLTL